MVREAGADRVWVTSAAPLDRARAAIESRIAPGHADGMQFTFRNPERSTAPTMSVPGARSIIVAARSYSCDRDVSAAAVVPARLAEHARWAAGKLGIGSLVCDELVP